MALIKSRSEEIYEFIKVPSKIYSIEQLHMLISSESSFTLIEEPFFKSIVPTIDQICRDKVEGDIVMVGVFKGGAALYLWSLFKEKGFEGKLWLFDSFKGFNQQRLTKAKDIESISVFGSNEYFQTKSSAIGVKTLFEKFELEQDVHIIEGFIEDTLKTASINKIAFLHIDVDAYDPTLFALEQLYPKLMLNGWCVLDDYEVSIFGCKEAVDNYRETSQISNEIILFGTYPAGWKKTVDGVANLK